MGKKKNNIILISSIIILPILGNVLFEFYNEYQLNKTPLKITYNNWLNSTPPNKNLILNNVDADLINSIYLKKFSIDDKPKKVFIPLITRNSTSMNNVTQIILSVNKGPLYDKIIEILEKKEEDVINESLIKPNKFKVPGPFKCYQNSASKEYQLLKESNSILSNDFVIMEQNGKFSFFYIIPPLLIFISAVFFLIRELFIRLKFK